MSRNSDAPLPPSLRDRLQEEDDASSLEAVWRLLGRIDELETNASPNPEEAWTAIRSRRPTVASEADHSTPEETVDESARQRSETGPSRSRRPASSPPRHHRWRRWAGSIAVVLCVVALGLWWGRQSVSVSAAPGEKKTATLPDGSTVEMNSGTTLSYRRGFTAWPFVEAERRRVQLEGEAFFAVEDANRPFVVHTFNAEVLVEGTDFNVKARPDRASTDVTLTEGRVRVKARNAPSRSVTLDEPGEASRVVGAEEAPRSPRRVDVDPVLAWRDRGFAATDEPLSAVLRELERRYDTTIRLDDSVNRTNRSVSVYYSEPAKLEHILQDISTALDLSFESTSQGYVMLSDAEGR